MSDIIEHHPSVGGGRYVIGAEGAAQAYLSYRIGDDGALHALSTYVPDQMRGQGIAMQLAERLIADARADGLRVVPICSYIVHHARKRSDWADVIGNAESDIPPDAVS